LGGLHLGSQLLVAADRIRWLRAHTSAGHEIELKDWMRLRASRSCGAQARALLREIRRASAAAPSVNAAKPTRMPS